MDGYKGPRVLNTERPTISSAPSIKSSYQVTNLQTTFYTTNNNTPANSATMTSLEGKEYTIYRGIDGKITSQKATIPALGPKDILIKITHSGVCYTDYECFKGNYPLSLGHEGIGTVLAVGTSVTQFQIGDRAGGGFHKSSCGQCEYCLRGEDIYCYERSIYSEGDFDNGTFGEFYIGKETFLHRIPEGMESEHAAPLQCAGATVYNALVDVVGTPAMRVGVVGIGGYVLFLSLSVFL